MLKNIFTNYWKSICVVTIIIYLSFATPSTFQGVPTFKHMDKVIHFLMYMTLTMALISDFHHKKRVNINTFSFVIFCLIFPAVFGGMIEIFQLFFFPPRSAEWDDWFSNIGGTFMGWFVMRFYLKSVD